MRYALNMWNQSDWNPVAELNRFWDSAFSPEQTEFQESFSPAVDVTETESHFVLNLDLPGIKKEDLNIQTVENRLVISGERKQENHVNKKSLRMSERSFGKFTRSFTLGNEVDATKIEAAFKDGVLTVGIPKVEAPKAVNIQIKEGEKEGFFQKLCGTKKEEKELN